MYKKRTDIQKSQKRPRAAFDEAVGGVNGQFGGEYGAEVSNPIKAKLNTHYGFNSRRRALSQNRSKFIIKDYSLDKIHPDLRITVDKEVFLHNYHLTNLSNL